MIKLYGFPLSTNLERVTIALAHKGISFEPVVIDPKDRSLVRRVSGQDLIPVIDDGGHIVFDSMECVRYLDGRYPEKPLYPTDRARRAEMLVFIDWFNRVWKRPPNEIEAEMGKPAPDASRIDRLGRAMKDALDTFEAMLSGRGYLMGDFSAADCCAFPFLRYAAFPPGNNSYLFHRILSDFQPLGTKHPNLSGWIDRMKDRPGAAGFQAS